MIYCSIRADFDDVSSPACPRLRYLALFLVTWVMFMLTYKCVFKKRKKRPTSDVQQRKDVSIERTKKEKGMG